MSEDNKTKDQSNSNIELHVDSAIQKHKTESIQLGESKELDISGLDKGQIQDLKIKQGEMALDRDDRRENIKTDLSATGAKLNVFGQAIRDSAEEEGSVTITNAHDDALGRTEIIMGNTEAARKGKLTRTQTGSDDFGVKFWLIFACIAAVVIIIVAALSNN